MMTHMQTKTLRLGSLPARTAKESCAEDDNAELHARLLDMMTLSMIVTDGDRRIVYANRQGDRLLIKGRALRDAMGRLSAANPRAAALLGKAISDCAYGNLSKIGRNGIPVFVTSENGHSLIAWVLPLWKPQGALSRLVALVVREDPETFSGESFSCRYGATPAELRIVEMLMKGLGTDEIAASLNISENTVKTHLKSLFTKTGTRRQADLLRVANATIAPAVRAD